MVLTVFTLSISLLFVSVESRIHSQIKHKHSSHPVSHISFPPSPSPEPYTPRNTVYDVRSFGAVGDGKADDTEAFKLAWDTLCQTEETEPVTLLLPKHRSFMIQSTIFTGPCRSNILFQVM